MARSKSLTVHVRIEGLDDTLRALSALPKEAADSLRTRTLALSQALAESAAKAGRSDRSPQSALVATTVKARRDRLPVIVAGGTRRLGRNRVPAWKLLFGSEFGSNALSQFRKKHTGRDGSWFFPTVEREKADLIAAWQKVADDIVNEFGS